MGDAFGTCAGCAPNIAKPAVFFKRSKCSFGQTKIEYLGHFISQKGVQVDDKKIAAMRNWPRLRNVTELRGFLELTGYYRKFVKIYGTIAAPLT